MKSLILQTVSRVVLFLLMLLSVYLLLRGHNAPGGGFIAGLLTASGVVLQLVAYDLDYVQRVFPVDWIKLVGAGLLLAAGVGIVPMLLGYPFLTSAFEHYVLPVVGHVEVTSAFFFDLGVYLVVVGCVLAVIKEIAQDRNFESNFDEVRAAVREDSEIWKY